MNLIKADRIRYPNNTHMMSYRMLYVYSLLVELMLADTPKIYPNMAGKKTVEDDPPAAEAAE